MTKKTIKSRKPTVIDNDDYARRFFGGKESQKKLVGRITKALWGFGEGEIEEIKVEEPEGTADGQAILSRTTRPAVTVKTKGGKHYAIEFQKKNHHNNLERMWYELEALTVEAARTEPSSGLQVGNGVAMFCDFDVFGQGELVYRSSLIFNGGSGKSFDPQLPSDVVFINTRKADPSSELGRLSMDLREEDPDRMFDDDYRKEARKVQGNNPFMLLERSFDDRVKEYADGQLEEMRDDIREEVRDEVKKEMEEEIKELRRQNEAVQKQNEAIQKQNEAMQKQMEEMAKKLATLFA